MKTTEGRIRAGRIRLENDKNFDNLKSNMALLYNKGHNLLTSAFPQKHVKLIKFPYCPYCNPSHLGLASRAVSQVGQNKMLQRNKNYCPS